MSDTRKIIDYTFDDNAVGVRDALYAAIHDKVTAHIEDKKQEIARGLIVQHDEDVEQISEKIEVKKEYNDKTEAEHGIYHNGKKIGYAVHHKPSGTHTAYHSPQSYDEKGHADDFGQIDDFHNHHDAVNQIRHSAGVGIHEGVDMDPEDDDNEPEEYDEEEDLEESVGEMHPRAGDVLKHIDPKHHDKYTPYLKKGTYTGSYSDRAAVLGAAEKAGHAVSESSPFSPDYKSQTMKPGEKAGFTSKKISTGTVYSRKPVKDEPATPSKKK